MSFGNTIEKNVKMYFNLFLNFQIVPIYVLFYSHFLLTQLDTWLEYFIIWTCILKELMLAGNKLNQYCYITSTINVHNENINRVTLFYLIWMINRTGDITTLINIFWGILL